MQAPVTNRQWAWWLLGEAQTPCACSIKQKKRKRQPACDWWWWCRYLSHLEESGVTAQVAEARQQQMLHCVLAQHCDNFTHDLSRKTHGRQHEEKTSHGFQELDRRICL